jgi:hypothetical protein
VDRPTRAPPGAGRPLDLARRRCLDDAAAGHASRPRPAAPLDTAPPAAAPDPLPRAPSRCGAPACPRHPRGPATTLWALTGAAQGPPRGASPAPPSRQEGRLTPSHATCVLTVPALTTGAALAVVKSQA